MAIVRASTFRTLWFPKSAIYRFPSESSPIEFGNFSVVIAAGDLRAAFDQELRALLAMKEYWGENDAVEMEGRQVQLVNELYAGLQNLTTNVRLTVLPERFLPLTEPPASGRFG